jgi:DNA-binding FadR family transcriptional regulator
VSRRGLHGELVAELGEAIASGAFAAGDLLAPEAIGDRFGVSRTVVREALRVLEAKGMVTARPNIGTKVRPVADWNLLDPDVIGWRRSDQEQTRQLLELRAALEPYAARLAARHGGRETADKLRPAVEAMAAALEAGDIRAFTRADLDFHASLLSGSHNALFDQLSATVGAALRLREDMLIGEDHLSEEAVEWHWKVVEAFELGDESAAEAAMRTMLDEVAHEFDERVGGHTGPA